MNFPILFYALTFTAALTLSGCSKEATPQANQVSPEALAVSVDNSLTSVAVAPATVAECASGGSVIQLFKDANSNGVFDLSESLVSATPVCNGASGTTGASGSGAGIVLAAVASGSCPAGGTVIKTFQDSNNNGVQDSSERTTSSSTICNGVNGNNGANGASAFITSTVASAGQCPAGGVVYSTHVDGTPPQSTVICSGVNGANGADGSNATFASGPVGSEIKGKPYTACHHDYLYLPDANQSDRGWLIFRHQKNGAADQGIGSTGFNVWNVDISDFYLVAETNGEVYCQLHWEPSKKVLTYVVVSKSDGAAGEKGEIVFK